MYPSYFEAISQLHMQGNIQVRPLNKMNVVWRVLVSHPSLLFVLQYRSILREKSIMWENQYPDKAFWVRPPSRIDFMQEWLIQLLMIY